MKFKTIALICLWATTAYAYGEYRRWDYKQDIKREMNTLNKIVAIDEFIFPPVIKLKRKPINSCDICHMDGNTIVIGDARQN